MAAGRAAAGAWTGAPTDNYTLSYTNYTLSYTQPSMFQDLPKEARERIDRYAMLWRYYRGNHKKHLRTRMTPAGPGPDDNVTINISRRVVNKGVDFLFSKPLTWQLDEDENTAAEEALEQVWRSDEWRMAFLAETGINGGVAGDFYFQIVPNNDTGIPRLINLDPSIVFPSTDPNDIETEWSFEIRTTPGKRTIHALMESGDAWETWEEEWTGTRWAKTGESMPWPYPWPMIVHGKNLPNPNSYFGCSDLEDADINDVINQVASNMNRIIRIFAHPIVWGRMMGNGPIDVSQVLNATNPDAHMDALELASEMNAPQEFQRMLRQAFSEITAVPQNDPDRLAIGAQSGFALKVLFNDLVLKTGIKHALYGMAIVETNRRVLELMGYGPDNITKLYWGDPLPTDERATTEGAKFDLDYNLASRQTVAEDRGYNWEVEQERMTAQNVEEGNVGEMLLRAFERGTPAQ